MSASACGGRMQVDRKAGKLRRETVLEGIHGFHAENAESDMKDYCLRKTLLSRVNFCSRHAAVLLPPAGPEFKIQRLTAETSYTSHLSVVTPYNARPFPCEFYRFPLSLVRSIEVKSKGTMKPFFFIPLYILLARPAFPECNGRSRECAVEGSLSTFYVSRSFIYDRKRNTQELSRFLY